MQHIRAVPVTYKGTTFRSTLEGDWAYNLDLWGIAWQYEPEAFQMPSGAQYRPDFYLPGLTTWLEVKGPHDERIEKTREFADTVMHYPDHELLECDCQERKRRIVGDRATITAGHLELCPQGQCRCHGDPWRLTVIGRPPVDGHASWEEVCDWQEIVLGRCRVCSHWNFHEEIQVWVCRGCGTQGKDARWLDRRESARNGFSTRWPDDYMKWERLPR